MLFYLYILSVSVSLIFNYIGLCYIIEKFKKDQIVIINHYSWLNELINTIRVIIKICLPVYNLLYVVYLIFFHSYIYQKLVTKLFLEGNATFK